MYDAASRSDVVRHQRAVGELRVSVRARGDATVLDNLRQAGCLKARFPRAHATGWLDVVGLNTSGGVAGGDRLDAAYAVADGARASFSSQAAERFYRALPGSAPAHVRTTISVAAGARAEWLPQETILFDGSALDRSLDIELDADARFLGIETLVFGRDLMGERVHQARLMDRIRIRRGGRWLLHDAVRMNGAVDAMLARTAVAKGARVVTTLFCVAPEAAARLDTAREVLAAHDVDAGASAWDGMLLVRMIGASSATVRKAAIGLLDVLRDGRPLPRVWLC